MYLASLQSCGFATPQPKQICYIHQNKWLFFRNILIKFSVNVILFAFLCDEGTPSAPLEPYEFLTLHYKGLCLIRLVLSEVFTIKQTGIIKNRNRNSVKSNNIPKKDFNSKHAKLFLEIFNGFKWVQRFKLKINPRINHCFERRDRCNSDFSSLEI